MKHAQLDPASVSPQEVRRLQSRIGNAATAALLRRSARTVTPSVGSAPGGSIQRDDDFTYSGGGIIPTTLSTQPELNQEVEELMESQYGGVDNLFLASDVANSTNQWGDLVHTYLSSSHIYVLQGLGRPEVRAAVRAVRAKYRQSTLLRMANNIVYRGSSDVPYSTDNLRAFLLAGGMRLEQDDDEVLDAIFETEGAFAKTTVEVPPNHLLMSEEGNIVIFLDDHQNKHQNPHIPELPSENVGQGSQFAQDEGLQYHRVVTAAQVRETIEEAIEAGTVSPESGSHSPPKNAINGIIYDLTITYDDDTGKYVGSYHCNPVVSRQ